MTRSQASTDLKRRTSVISDGIGAIHREHYGRGAGRIRTVIHQAVVMTSLDDCYTTVEKKMVADGAFLQVTRDENRSRTGCGLASSTSSRRAPAGK